jgi:hypothetical protein
VVLVVAEARREEPEEVHSFLLPQKGILAVGLEPHPLHLVVAEVVTVQAEVPGQ